MIFSHAEYAEFYEAQSDVNYITQKTLNHGNRRHTTIDLRSIGSAFSADSA